MSFTRRARGHGALTGTEGPDQAQKRGLTGDAGKTGEQFCEVLAFTEQLSGANRQCWQHPEAGGGGPVSWVACGCPGASPRRPSAERSAGRPEFPPLTLQPGSCEGGGLTGRGGDLPIFIRGLRAGLGLRGADQIRGDRGPTCLSSE